MNGLITAATVRIATLPELRFTKDGLPSLQFSAIVLDSKAGPDAEPEWLRVSLWDELAQSLEKELRKGMECYLEGRLRHTTWTTRDGEQRSGISLSAWKCQPFAGFLKRSDRAAA